MFKEPMVFITIALIVTFIYSFFTISYLLKGDFAKHRDILGYYRLFYIIFPIAAAFVGGFKYGILSFLILFITPLVCASVYHYIGHVG